MDQMEPAELILTTRTRYGLSQERLARRARTTQAAISRIERGEESVTWARLQALLAAMGEEPELTTRPIPHDLDANDLLLERRKPMARRLVEGVGWNAFATRMFIAGARAGTGAARVGEGVNTPEFKAGAIFEVLADHAFEYVVIGGIAVQAHGHTRTTRDLDIMPAPGLVNFSRLAEALVDLEATWRKARRPRRLDDPQGLARADHLPLRTRYGYLDVMSAQFAARMPYADLRSRAIASTQGDITIMVAGLDDLIRMKHAAGRDEDLRDIAALTRNDTDLKREARRQRRT